MCRIISIILAFAVLICTVLVVKAEDGTDNPVFSQNFATYDSEDTVTDETDTAVPTDDSDDDDTDEATDEPVVKLYLCERMTEKMFGHIWVYFENLTDEELTVGYYTLPPGQGVSAGTFLLNASDGVGVYYNAEAYSVSNYGISGIWSLSTTMTRSQLDKASKRVRTSNYWMPFINDCAEFAFKVWNCSSEKPKLISLVIPYLSRLEVKMLYDDISEDLVMYSPSPEQVCRQRYHGIEQASEDMLKKIM